MGAAAARLEIFEGAEVLLGDTAWTVSRLQPQVGLLELERDGESMATSLRALMNDRGWSQRDQPGRPGSFGRQPNTIKDLTPFQQEVVALRLAHLLEVETGFRSGDALRACDGEPQPRYDPTATTVVQRRHAKADELAASHRRDPDAARLLGLEHVSYRTLTRWESRRRRFGPIGVADDRWMRPTGPRWSITEPVREAIYAVRAETLHRSRLSMATRARLVHQYVLEKFGSDVEVPGYRTLSRVWREWFGADGQRQRYVRSAAVAGANATGQHVVVHRPGQVVALDTTPLPVLIREGVFGEPVEAHLTIALDVYTHSLVAFRLTLVSESSVDVAMLLRDVMTPLPMRPGWGPELAWPYPGIPEAVVADLAGYPVAGLPFLRPETVTTDHGSVYKNHHLVEVQRVIGANIRPSRVLRPTDKAACERAFGAIQSLLFQTLPGYRGVDVADRGVDPLADSGLDLTAMEHLIATWIVAVWQNRRFGEYAPGWDPGGDQSPNTLFAAAMAQGGFAVEIPRPELFYELLPVHHVMIHGKQGVRIRGLRYYDPVLDDCGAVSRRGGVHKSRWAIRSDPRDARYVFFQHPDTGAWHKLPWSGLPPEGEIPAFNDARVKDLLRQARVSGLKPKTDAELLPVLLELLGGNAPVAQWPTQMDRQQRRAHTREVSQSLAAETDRGTANGPSDTVVVPLRRPDRAGQTGQAVDAERRLRRERAMAERVLTAPQRLGQAASRSSPLRLAAGSPDDQELA